MKSGENSSFVIQVSNLFLHTFRGTKKAYVCAYISNAAEAATAASRQDQIIIPE